MKTLGFCLLLVFTLPPLLLWVQGQWVRRRVPRLPEAQGRRSGYFTGQGAALRLLVVGESPAVGVGLAHIQDSMAVQTAKQIAQLSGRPVRWSVLGYSGAKMADLVAAYASRIQCGGFDLAMIVSGVNDSTGHTAAASFETSTKEMISLLRARQSALPIVLAGIPPLKDFPALPEPLASWLGGRAQRLDAVLAVIAKVDLQLRHLPCGAVEVGEFAADGFHPDAMASTRWAQELATACCDLVATTD